MLEHRKHTGDEITPAGIELKPSSSEDKPEPSERVEASKESMPGVRFSDLVSFFSFSMGVFVFGVIHDFVQESVFRIEGYDYG